MDIGEHRVLVTGGTRGIGLALATAFQRRGAAVAVCGRAEPGAGSGGDAGEVPVFFRCDLTRGDEVRDLVARVRSEFGSPTILVNIAGVQFNHRRPHTPTGERESLGRTEVLLNLVAPVSLTALLLDDLLGSDEAAIVNITSILALAPKRSAPVYSRTKAGIRGLTRGLRDHLSDAPHVRVVEGLEAGSTRSGWGRRGPFAGLPAGCRAPWLES